MSVDAQDLRAKAREARKRRQYAARHRTTRALLAPLVAAGLAECVRCGEPIEAGEPWDLGHDDYDPRVHAGPEHPSCNRGAPHRNVTSRAW